LLATDEGPRKDPTGSFRGPDGERAGAALRLRYLVALRRQTLAGRRWVRILQLDIPPSSHSVVQQARLDHVAVRGRNAEPIRCSRLAVVHQSNAERDRLGVSRIVRSGEAADVADIRAWRRGRIPRDLHTIEVISEVVIDVV